MRCFSCVAKHHRYLETALRSAELQDPHCKDPLQEPLKFLPDTATNPAAYVHVFESANFTFGAVKPATLSRSSLVPV
jgi:hypothetical protein